MCEEKPELAIIVKKNYYSYIW